MNGFRFARRFTLGTGLALPAILLVGAGLSHVSAQPPAAGELAGNSKLFRNIKVLKDVPADKLIPMMHNWNDSLGVQCDFCHVVGPDHKDFWRDDKPMKKTARAMVMMAQDVNKHQKIVGGKVTCFTCHHGKTEPQREPEGGAGRR